MDRRIALLAIQLFFVSLICESQKQSPAATEIYGTIKDAKTKQVIPYAVVHLKGKESTQTDQKGFYYIHTISKIDSISVSLMGYQTVTLPVRWGEKQEINVFLKELAIQEQPIPVH